MPILELKGENITMHFIVGLPQNLGKFVSIWVIMYKLTKLAYFALVKVNYSVEKLCRIHIQDVV